MVKDGGQKEKTRFICRTQARGGQVLSNPLVISPTTALGRGNNTMRRKAEALGDLFAILSARRQPFFNRGHMKSGNGHTGIITKPHHNPA